MITMVIPTYTLNKELEEIAWLCADSYKSQVDQIIIIEDGGTFSERLKKISDIYIYSKENVGFTKNVNRGWRMSEGDFTMIVNSDTFLIEGNLKDLCIPNKVSSPSIENQYVPRLAGPFWVVPREIKEQRGMLLEEMHTFESDSEYDNRVADIFQKVSSVIIHHREHKTVDPAGVNTQAQKDKDKAIHDKLKVEGKVKYVPIS